MSATLSQVDAVLGKSAIKEHFWVKEGEFEYGLEY